MYKHVVQSLEGVKYPDTRFYDCNKLAFKLYSHATTIYWLRQGTKAPVPKPNGSSFFDSASVAVLARSIFETYLVMFELFFENISDDEREFRYTSWVLRGITIRENITPLDPALDEKVNNSKIEIEQFRERIRNTQVFKFLSEKRKRRILQGRDAPDKFEHRIKNAGFAPITIERLHQYLSSYVHADGLSAIQIMDAKTREDQEENIDGLLYISMMVMSKMILAYCNLFEVAKIACMDRPEAFQLANIFSNVAGQLDEIKRSNFYK